MKIKSIKGSGIKVQTFEHDLKAINIILGDNAEGKSSRMDAIRLLLLGHLPELGKTNSATMQLCAGKELSVTGELDNGKGFWRNWKTGKSIEATVGGSIPDVPIVLMDPTVYLNLSEKERVKYVFGLAQMSDEWTAEKIVREIAHIVTEPDEPHEEVHEELIGRIDDSDTYRHESGEPVQAWLDALVVACTADLSEANAAKARMEKFAQGMVELKSADEESNTHNRAGEIKRLREFLSLLQKKDGGFIQTRNSAANLRVKREQLMADMARLPDCEAESKALSQTIAQLEAEQAELPPEIDLEIIRRSITDLELKNQSAKDRLATARKGITASTVEKETTLKNERCPCCNSKSKTWRESFEAKMEEKLTALGDEAANSNALVTQYSCELGDEKKRLVEAGTQQFKRQSIGSQLQVARNRADIELPAKQQRRILIQQQLNDLSEAPAYDEQADKENMAEIARTDTTIQTLERTQNLAIAAMADQKRVAESKEQLVQATAKAVVLKLVVAKLQEIQAKMVESAFGDILRTANTILGMYGPRPLIKTPLAYQDGELGRFEGKVWVSHKTFSGMEKKLTYVALSASLAKDSPIRIVLMDEMGVMTRPRRMDFIWQMDAMVKAGHIDQFVGIDADGEAYADSMDLPEGINFITVENA